MIHWAWWAGAAVALSLVAVSCRREPVVPDAPQRGHGETVAIVRLLQGSHSGIDCEGLEVCRDADSFAELWRKHTRLQLPGPAVPEVDFHNMYVVCAFAGSRPSGGYAVSIDALEPTQEGVRILAHEERPEPGSMQVTVMTAPFEFVLVPRFEGTAELVWSGQ